MKKHPILSALLAIPVILTFSACEEVIQLELKNTEPRMVIEATLNATSGVCTVCVTKSLDFYEADGFDKIDGALVELTDEEGGVRILTPAGEGVYSANSLMVTPGKMYQLSVLVSPGEIYLAETRAPQPVFLDSLKVIRGFGDPRPTAPPIYLINPVWLDPAGVENYYRFKVTNNGKPSSGSFVITSDEPFDGTEVDTPLYRFGFMIGDTVSLEFQSIDAASYAYFTQVNDMARPSFVSATPYNPVGNFNNSALGYFGIYYSDIREVIVRLGGK